ncbi:unnamed protein product [Phytomonas sp. EM1]|nr:unnamed protein product [Phytomonas sp. EM1]|eukprot:CCW65726.1 unnamed protein product [Phytomonas sp. isolate EM1]
MFVDTLVEEAADPGASISYGLPSLKLSSSRHHLSERKFSPSYELHQSTLKLTGYLHHFRKLHSGVPELVTFEVGGVEFTVHRNILEKDQHSLLFTLASQHYLQSKTNEQDVCRDEYGRCKRGRKITGDVDRNPRCDGVGDKIVIPGKDPIIFGMILNFLRGYTNAIRSPAWKEACEADIEYYGLWKSWSARYSLSLQYKFNFLMTGSQLFSDLVCGIASPYFSSGIHAITFAIAHCDRVGVGVSMELGLSLPHDIVQEGHGKVFYWNDGKITSNLIESKVADTGCPFGSSTEIQIYLDSDENTVRWVVNGDDCVSMQRLPKGKSFAFCAVAARISQIDILTHRSVNYL